MKTDNKSNKTTHDMYYNLSYSVGLELGIQIGKNDMIKRGNEFGVSNDLLALSLDLPIQEIEQRLAKMKLGLV